MSTKVDLPQKFTEEVLDYTFKWSSRLGTDTIVSSDFTLVSNGSIVIESDSFTSNTTTVWVSGGTAGSVNKILNVITTAAGRTMAIEAKLKIIVP